MPSATAPLQRLAAAAKFARPARVAARHRRAALSATFGRAAPRRPLSTTLYGKDVFAHLPPTKTVLCVVPATTPYDERPAELGLAVTDPYLGHARALPPVAIPRRSLADKTLAWPRPVSWSPDELAAMHEVARACEQHDVGALAFGLPMADDETPDAVAERDALLRLAADFASGATMTYWSEARGAPFEAPRSLAAVSARHGRSSPQPVLPKLRCLVDDRLTRADVAERRLEEPEVWADVDGDGPSHDAAVALSAFLYEYSGGWRNTFG